MSNPPAASITSHLPIDGSSDRTSATVASARSRGHGGGDRDRDHEAARRERDERQSEEWRR
jgi:hypothetical protein